MNTLLQCQIQIQITDSTTRSFFFRKFPNLFLDTTPCGIYYKSLDDRTLILTFVGADFREVIKAMM